MVWSSISLTGKMGLVVIGGNLNAERCLDEILQPVAIPYLHSLRPNPILQDDNARPHRAGFIRDYLQNLGVERMEWPASSPDLNPIEHLWDQLGRAVRARVKMGRHPTAVCDQAGDQHEDEVPGCCGCVWFFHTLLRLPFVK